MTRPYPAIVDCSRLIWLPEHNLGYCHAPPIKYEAGYWDTYRQLDKTPMGIALTRARCDLVRRHYREDREDLVDIGVGGGAFVEAAECFGYDINPEAERWLIERSAWRDPYEKPVGAASLWDCLEHIPDPGRLLKQVRQWVFMSIPIFEGGEHALRSKHFKPGEHLWYFTREGLIWFMGVHGFELMEINDTETQLGREGIESFAFRRT